jgi:hypothetical protein
MQGIIVYMYNDACAYLPPLFFMQVKKNHTDSKEEFAFVLENGTVANKEKSVILPSR